MKNLIVVKLQGQLGNQMFQYALYRSLLSKGLPVSIDLSWFKDKATLFKLPTFSPPLIMKQHPQMICRFC